MIWLLHTATSSEKQASFACFHRVPRLVWVTFWCVVRPCCPGCQQPLRIKTDTSQESQNVTPPADTGLPIEIKIYTGDNAAGGREVGGAAPGAPSPGLLLSRNGRNRGGGAGHGGAWSAQVRNAPGCLAAPRVAEIDSLVADQQSRAGPIIN